MVSFLEEVVPVQAINYQRLGSLWHATLELAFAKFATVRQGIALDRYLKLQ